LAEAVSAIICERRVRSSLTQLNTGGKKRRCEQSFD